MNIFIGLYNRPAMNANPTTTTPVLDATSPDSGVGDGEILGEDLLKKKALEDELVKIEGEVLTLRQVLKNKVERANEIRTTLAAMGYGDRNIAELLWVKGGALGESIGGGLDNLKKSAPVMRAGEVISDLTASATPLYQKTVEKTSGLFSKLKENTAYTSISERVGGVYQAARSKIPGAGGDGNLEQAFQEGGAGAVPQAAPGMEGVAPVEGGVPLPADQQMPPQQQQQPQQQQLA